MRSSTLKKPRWLFFSAILAALLIPPAALADFVFYASMNDTDDDTAELWLYDTVEDTHRLIGKTGRSVHAIDFDTSGVLYGLSGRRGGTENGFFTINLFTGAATDIGSNPECCQTEISFNETGTVLYAIDRNGYLRSVDIADGSMADIGDGAGQRGMAIDSAGNAYQSDAASLYTVNVGTGATVLQGAFTGLTYSWVMGMDFGPSDTLYGVNFSRCCSFSSKLYTIDAGTRAATFLEDLPGVATAIAVTSGADTDSDGIHDIFELAAGKNPNDASDADDDSDGDGLTFAEEYALGSSDSDTDSDDDGLADGEEVDLGTDPTNADSDKDHIGDSVEVLLIGLDPTVADNGRVELSGGSSPRHVNIAEDADGRFHLVWDADDGTGEWRVYYGLLDADGNILIDGTVVADANGNNDAQPQVAVGADGKAHIVWQDPTNQSYFALVDPSADNQDGDAANPVDIVEVSETSIDSYVHGQIAVDADGNTFLVAEDLNTDIALFKIDNTGTVVAGPTSVIFGSDAYHTVPGIAIDADGNLHMAWGEDGRLFYAMASGGDTSLLIEPTFVATATVGTNGGNNSGAKFANPVFDADGILHIVFADKNGESSEAGGEIVYIAVDPSRDDQNGDAADADDIVVQPAAQVTALSLGAGDPWYPDAAFDGAGNLSVVWNGGGGGDDPPETVMAATVDGNGNVSSATRLTSTLTHTQSGDSSRIAPPHVAGNRVAFSDDNVVATVTFGSTADEAAAGFGKVSLGTLRHFSNVAEADLPTEAEALPEGVEFPFGFYRLVVSDLAIGQTTTLTLNLPEDLPEGVVVYKYTPADGWFEIPFIPGFAANQISVELTDGGETDADGEANGVLVDPIAIGVVEIAAQPTGTPVNVTGGGGGGCVIGDGNRPMDPLFPALLALAAAYFIRRRMTN